MKFFFQKVKKFVRIVKKNVGNFLEKYSIIDYEILLFTITVKEITKADKTAKIKANKGCC